MSPNKEGGAGLDKKELLLKMYNINIKIETIINKLKDDSRDSEELEYELELNILMGLIKKILDDKCNKAIIEDASKRLEEIKKFELFGE
ncbi:MAG: hypothetical protein GY797_31800 [Deltaproteobacteria bacterium]|nr:hypothetical protein [Deltaproteobacteria bacterium]